MQYHDMHPIDRDCNLDWSSMQVLLFMSPKMILWPAAVTEHTYMMGLTEWCGI